MIRRIQHIRLVVVMLGIYAIFAPFDTLLDVTAGGTITKYVGVIIILLALSELIRKGKLVSPGGEVYAWAAFLLFSLTSVMWAQNLDDSKGYLVTTLSLFALFAFCALLEYDGKDVLFVSMAVVCGGTIVSLYSIELLRYATSANIQATAGQSRLYLTLGENMADPNHTAAALLLPIALAITLIFRTRCWLLRAILLSSIILMLCGVYLSGSRGGALGTAVLLLYLAAKSTYRRWFLGVGSGLLVAFLTIPNEIFARIVHDQGFGSGRGGIWHVGILAFKQHWLYGAGAFNFGDVFDKIFLHTNQGVFQAWHRPAHDLFLSTAVELGIIGLGILLVALYAQFTSLREVSRSTGMYDLRIAMEAAMLALFVIALFIDMIPRKYLWLALIQAAMLRIAAVPALNTRPICRGPFSYLRRTAPSHSTLVTSVRQHG